MNYSELTIIDVPQQVNYPDSYKFTGRQFGELYEKGLNDSEIGKALGVNNATITLYRKRHDINKNYGVGYRFNKEEFIKLHNLSLNDREIAERLNSSISTIRTYRNILDLKPNRLQTKVNLSKLSKGVLLGTLLGDGHLTKIPKGNAHGMFAHSLKQKEYAIWKYNILKELCGEPIETYQIDKRNGKRYDKICINIRSNSILNEIYQNLYVNKIKIISDEFLEQFDDVSLSVFYQDDGFITNHGYTICLDCFDVNSITRFQNHLYKLYDIKSTLHKNCRVHITSQYKLKFKEIIEPYFIESMKYKL